MYPILWIGRLFITQQVGGRNCDRLNELIEPGIELQSKHWTLEYAARELEQAGFRVLQAHEELTPIQVSDVGAVVYYLKHIPWQIPGFTVEKYRDQLAEVHNLIQETGGLELEAHRFLIVASKGQAIG